MKASKLTALILSVVMMLGMFPLTAFATSADSLSVDGPFATPQLTVATEKNSTLAPGITQDSYTLYNNKDEQVKMFITTADMSVDTVKLFASYKDMDPTNYGMSKLTEQVASFNEKAAAGDEYYQGTVVAGINASYYNMITGKPTGTFVMNGVDVTTESEGNAYGYFAVMKDGSVKIGNKGDYSNDKGNIQEAIGIYTMLIVDGQICSGLNTTQYYPRQTIGITADGDVILMTADGNQAPKSVGLTVLEQAQVMLDLGCVWAGHLDGGGSCTYAAKAEGSNDFSIVNSPSDGSERSVSNGFLIASTAVSDGIFASAALATENEYVTPGSTVEISASGVDKAGGFAEIPENISWQLADSSYGSVSDGIFVSNGKVGIAVVQMVYEGNVVGEVSINVVIPDKITFASSEMTVPYSKSVPLTLTATYGARDVAIKSSDIKFVLSNPAVGTISDFTFVACEENPAVISSDITATLVFDESVSDSSKITLGKGSEVVYDFEDGTNQTVIFNETPGTKYNYVWPESEQFVATNATGKVHGGKYSLGAQVNYANSLESGYMRTSIYSTENKVFKNAVGVGVWMYIPDEFVGLWARWTLRSVTFDADGNPVYGGAVNSNLMDTTAGGTGVVSTFDEPGWHYLYADTSAYGAVGWQANGAMIQLYISDRDGSAYGYTAADYSNIPSKFTIYIDDVTVDYSTAVDDREAPILSNVTYATEGMADAAVLNGNTINTNKVTIAASVAENTTKSNFSGLDETSVKAYVDGVEHKASFAAGKISLDDITLDNGKHIVKFAAYDKMGNYGYIYQTIVINASESRSTIKLVAADETLDRIKLGSVYNMNLLATAIEEVKSVEVAIDLDNNSVWQLAHMTVAEGFEATYEIDETDNVAYINFVKVGECAKNGEAVLATLPVRVWTLKTGYTYENGTKAGQQAMTLKQFRDGQEFWRMSVIANVDYGFLTRVDESGGTFTGERVFCDTEMWGNYAKMSATTDGLAYYNSWNGGHIHTAEAVDDKASTCTESGYTGRTFCSDCNSVVDWGITVSATGHNYQTVEGVLKCSCGELFNGVYTDGKTYVDGVIVANGWNGESYFVDGVMLTGLQKIDGYYYDFGDNGICPNKARVDGFFYDKSINAYRCFSAGSMVTGDITIYPDVYYYDADGVAISGQVDMLGYSCLFDEKGAFISSTDPSVVDAGYSGTNIKYVLLSDGTMYLGGKGAIRDYTANGLYAPWSTKNGDAIKKVVIGNEITHIGVYVFFKHTGLKTVEFEENSQLKTLAYGAFSHCYYLSEITLPASVETIDTRAFFKCSGLWTVSFEEGSKIKYIGSLAFGYGGSLRTVELPATLETIKIDIFTYGREEVVVQVVEDSRAHEFAKQNNWNIELVEGEIPAVASGTCGDNATWTYYASGKLVISGSGAMDNYARDTQPWSAHLNKIKHIVIGKDITSVGDYAFAYAHHVESVTFEEGSKLERIGVLSFFYMLYTEEVVIPETVTYVGSNAFGYCSALVNVYIPQEITYIHTAAFRNSTKVNINVAEGSYSHKFAVNNGINHTVRPYADSVIASGTCGDEATWTYYASGKFVVSGSGAMDNYAMGTQPWSAYNNKIKHIVIGKDITSVGDYAFAYAHHVESVTFEEGSKLERIGVLSFFYMLYTEEVVIPETVTYIGSMAFGYCAKLENVVISSNDNLYVHPKTFYNTPYVYN